MKVIKQGTAQPAWNKRVKCSGKDSKRSGCGSVLEITEEDLYETCWEHYWGETDYFNTFTCPECGKENDIKNLPDGVELLGKRPSEKFRNSLRLKLARKNKRDPKKLSDEFVKKRRKS